jgi:hypothetical protein
MTRANTTISADGQSRKVIAAASAPSSNNTGETSHSKTTTEKIRETEWRCDSGGTLAAQLGRNSKI